MPMPSSSDRSIVSWTNYLNELLEEAKLAAGGDKKQTIDVVATKLRIFEERSPFEARALDRIAIDAEVDLRIASIETRINNIKARVDDFNRLYDTIMAAVKPKKAGSK